jgi:hypothetical protein
MQEVTASAAVVQPEASTGADSLVGRVTGLIKRARRAPVLVAIVACVVAVVAVVLLVPASPSSTVANASANVGKPPGVSPLVTKEGTEANVPSPSQSPPLGSLSQSSPTPSGIRAASEPEVPLSTLGDFLLVRVPSATGQGPGDIAVLERAGDSWIVRETYPAS